ncbi:zinc finger CW-type PWWP domain protein 2 [Rhinatrema bivittatum]|uniref:zinc finger CW-type PWWP domain protein 2 n=1 Tax=Rhinatrema bivittatum TaxID=194408 RepID=UPI001128EF88|nr:zinc finger CW-type PWWP domain protein 2 [Rhinatrema bivittatum]
MEHITTKPIVESSFYQNKVWFQCENGTCLKWRLLSKEDSLLFDHSAPWYCHMNIDPCFNNCTIPEEYFPEESQFHKNGLKLIYSQFPVGSLVLVKYCTWPRWPAILYPDSLTGQYVKYDSDGYVNKYHVEFLGSPHTRAWISVEHVSAYQLSFKTNQQKKRSIWYESALEEAKKMYAFTCKQRLSMCQLTEKGSIKKEVERAKEKNRKLSSHKMKDLKEYIKKNSPVVRKTKKRRILFYSFRRNNIEDILSKENMVVSETENILKDLDQVLKQVTVPGEMTQLPVQKEVMKNKKKVSRYSMSPFEGCDEEDCVIIDGIIFKTGECIENITDTFKELDTLMSELQDDF